MKLLLLDLSQQPAHFKGGQRKDSGREYFCGFLLRGWPDFVFSGPRVLIAPGTGTGECSSRFTGKCQVRHPSRALSLLSGLWHLGLGKGGAEKGT